MVLIGQDLVDTRLFMSGDTDEKSDSLYMQASRHLGLDPDKIGNILPCTPFQLDVVDCAANDGRRAIGHVVYEIPKDVNMERLAASWKAVTLQTPALRTRIFTSESGDHFQVVVSESFTWTFITHLGVNDAVVEEEAAAVVAGAPCSRYAVLRDPSTEQTLFIWTFSYALVDDAFREHILTRVLTVYEAGVIQHSPRPDPESATRFWQQHFDGLNASVFPALPSHLGVPHADAVEEYRISYTNLVQQKWSNTITCRAALAVLLARYTHASEALFGVVVERPHLPKGQEHAVDGPKRTVVPTRVLCAPDKSGSDLMQAIAAHDAAMGEFEQIGLRGIRRTGDCGSAACGFQTVLAVTAGDAPQEPSSRLHRAVVAGLDRFVPCTDRALLLNCQMVDDSALLLAQYDPKVIDARQVTRFLRQLGRLIQQFQNWAVDLHVRELDAITQEDQTEIKDWNLRQIRTTEVCIHDVITTRATGTPLAPAVFAWDGEWTYAELDSLSSLLAGHIQSLDCHLAQAVPLFFEKSKWVVAGMIAVLKAGRAFTLIDSSSPPARIAQICKQTSATVVLASKRHRDVIGTAVPHCIVVDDDLLQSLSRGEDRYTPVARPQDLAYIIFTSGSTGEPKGSMIEHRGFASCSLEFAPTLTINENTRALQFASYAFGACLIETLTTLMHGGCVCVPSEDDRLNDVPGFINRAGVNWALFTPSFIGALQPESVRGVQTLVLGGEPMSAEMRDTWASRVQLLYAYGQSETSTICSVTKVHPDSADLNNIGGTAGARFWITDPSEPDRLAPVGCIGELVIESPGIAHGYLVHPPQSTSPFLATTPAWHPSRELPDAVRFYQTGDLVRYRSDGSVLYLGRRDSQVKIRGQRVELGDVETHLRRQLAGDMISVVEAIRKYGASNSTILVAFLIGPFGIGEDTPRGTSAMGAYILESSAANRIKTMLQEIVPQHAIPSYYIRMEHLPTTATGKTDRRRLRSISTELLDEATRNVTAPQEEQPPSSASLEGSLRQVWFRSLNLDPNSDSGGANFFDLGGDSIIAIKMVNMARSSGIALNITDIFQNPTLTGLVDVVQRGSTPHSQALATAYRGPVEQSFAQGRLWFLDQFNLSASWYLMPLAVRMRGPLQVKALTAALCALEQRHETLRTTFEERNGIGMQVVQESRTGDLRVLDVAAENNGNYVHLLQQEQTAPFDLSSEPGWRVLLLRLGDDDHILSIVMHHIISDGWSLDVLRQELGKLYAAAARGEDPLSSMSPLPIQYRDFAVWQRQDEQVAEHRRQLEYWTKQLEDSTPAELLCDRPRPPVLSGEAGVVRLAIEGPVYESLRAFCGAHQVTPFVLLLAAFRAAHYRLTGAEDATIGTPIANRNRPELESMIGFFVNTQCMRSTVSDGDTFGELVRKVRWTATAAFENQDVPFENIVSALQPGSRDTSRNPLVQLLFALHSQRDLDNIELEGLVGEPIPTEVATRFDMEFHVFQEKGRLRGSVLFSTDLFEPESIRGMVAVFMEVLRRGLEQPQALIATLPLIDGVAGLRSTGLLKIERTEYPQGSSLVDVFREQVANHPNATAVADSTSRLTYSQLDRESDELAGWLHRRNMTTETLVGVLAPRSCQTIVAFIGILKANLAYLPLDVNSPTGRIEAILSAVAGNKLVLLGPDVSDREIQLTDVELVRIDDTLGPHGLGCPLDAAVRPSATSLAYVMFTSGSTGKPKGVMIEHRGVLRLVKQSNAVSKLTREPRVAHLSNIAFDASTWEIYTALMNAGTVVCVDYITTLDSKALEGLFAREQVHAAMLTPALLKQCLATAPAMIGNLDVLLAAGDRLDSFDAIKAQALVRAGVYNAYGPTENTILSTIYSVGPDDNFANGVPIGRAVSNSGVYIMDAQLQLVPVGVMGELVVTGDGLARGYTDPLLDQDRFVQVIIDGQLVRAYRTGDRARHRPTDGQIEFFGRMDQQVKIRGHRIEPAEVEHAMLSHSSVRDAAVVVRAREGGESEMVGFVVAQSDEVIKQDEASSQVEGWGNHFETSTYEDIESIDWSAIGSDFMGWTSMYDKREIDKTEMQEWLDDTMQTLLGGQAAGNVLEIGTGTGMILFNLGEGMQRYVGLEPSASAAAFVNNTVKSIPTLAGRADVHVGTATDVGRLDGICPDMVVLNSVVQYFPTPEYLTEVVDVLTQIPGVKRLFFGDMRPHSLNKDFLAARALHVLGEEVTKENVQRKMAELEEREEELLVDPAFFTGLKSQMPGRVRHVEILPKRMRATNELSSYRYAAVVHLCSPLEQTPSPIHAINTDAWVDFRASQLDFQGLLRLLRSSPDATAIAVSKIPHSKTILERHIVESLDEDGTIDGAAWVSDVRRRAERCASLSAADLVQLSKEAGFHVELSWARQQSQNGALDAVFHHYPPANEASRVLFQFPTDDPGPPLGPSTNSPTNRPLQQLQSRRIGTQIRERLRTLLPAYMVPAQVMVVDQMPVNANGKVDRRELSRRAGTTPTVFGSEATARVAPRNEVEAALCEEFADVLGVDLGITDNFFDLGGHSLMATKLAARISRRLDIRVSVRDVFDQPVPLDLANKIHLNQSQNHVTSNGSSRTADSTPFQLLPFEDPREFVRREVSPQLGDHHGRIVDVYPATEVQKIFLRNPATGHPRTPEPFYMDFPPEADSARLTSTCAALVQHFDIFRTVFLSVAGKFYQVVLEQLDVPVEVIEIEEDVTSATRAILDVDRQQPLRLGKSLLRIAILEKRPSLVRIVLRISHASYDGISLERIVRSFHSLYNGDRLPTPPKFARYVQHMVNSREEGYEFWRSVLQHSSMTAMESAGSAPQQPGDAGAWVVTRLINAPAQANADGITQATVFTTACALMIGKETGSSDVLFGRVVSGRQCLPISCQHVVGPCTNLAPVRVCIDNDANPRQLLHKVQGQYLSSLPFETLGLEELKQNCTDWPEAIEYFGCCTTYQNFEMHPESTIQGQKIWLEGILPEARAQTSGECNAALMKETLDEAPIHNVDIIGIPEPDGLNMRVILKASQKLFEESTVDHMHEELCERIQALTLALQDPVRGNMVM